MPEHSKHGSVTPASTPSFLWLNRLSLSYSQPQVSDGEPPSQRELCVERGHIEKDTRRHWARSRASHMKRVVLTYKSLT